MKNLGFVALALIGAVTAADTCTTGVDRLKASVANYKTLTRLPTAYTDPTFNGDQIIASSGLGNGSLDWVKAKGQKRLQDVYPNSSLWGNEGIRPYDIKQGQIGNCWLISSIAAVAEVPSRIQKIFLTDSVN